MKYLLLVLVCLAVWHFVYDGILLPTLRLRLRYRLFALRDRLRSLKASERAFDDAVYTHLQGSINNGLSFLHVIDMQFVADITAAIAQDEALRKRVEDRRLAVDACPIREVKEIYHRIGSIGESAVFSNSGGWLIYLVPAALVAVFFQKVKRDVEQVVSIPEPEVQRLMSTACPNLNLATA